MPYVRPSPDPKPARAAYPSDLTDAEWLRREPLLPVTVSVVRYAHRDLIDGIRYVLRGRNPWRAMPHDLPPWQTVASDLRDWTINGTWKRIHDH